MSICPFPVKATLLSYFVNNYKNSDVVFDLIEVYVYGTHTIFSNTKLIRKRNYEPNYLP